MIFDAFNKKLYRNQREFWLDNEWNLEISWIFWKHKAHLVVVNQKSLCSIKNYQNEKSCLSVKNFFVQKLLINTKNKAAIVRLSNKKFQKEKKSHKIC